MKLGTTIRKLRHQRDLTQEQLAEYLNVTVSAVSQWESGKTVPDISMILSLSGFFDVTLDELFDRTNLIKQKDIEQYDNNSLELRNSGEVAGNLILWREAVAKYPGDFHCIIELAYALFSTIHAPCLNMDETANAKECIAICERLLRDCIDNNIRSNAIQLLVLIYSNPQFEFANEDKAYTYANMASGLYMSRDVLMSNVYFSNDSKEKKIKSKQNLTLTLADLLCMELMNAEHDNPKDKILSLKAALTIWETLIYDDNYLFYNCRISSIYMSLARCYAKLENKEQVICTIKKALYYARKYDNQQPGEQNFTSVFLNLSSNNAMKTAKNHTFSQEELVLMLVNNKKLKEFDFVREDIEFNKLREG